MTLLYSEIVNYYQYYWYPRLKWSSLIAWGQKWVWHFILTSDIQFVHVLGKCITLWAVFYHSCNIWLNYLVIFKRIITETLPSKRTYTKPKHNRNLHFLGEREWISRYFLVPISIWLWATLHSAQGHGMSGSLTRLAWPLSLGLRSWPLYALPPFALSV